jgi:hypothetical protein
MHRSLQCLIPQSKRAALIRAICTLHSVVMKECMGGPQGFDTTSRAQALLTNNWLRSSLSKGLQQMMT